jgi:hypothetical protein
MFEPTYRTIFYEKNSVGGCPFNVKRKPQALHKQQVFKKRQNGSKDKRYEQVDMNCIPWTV